MASLNENQKFWARVTELARQSIGKQAYDFFIEPAQLMSVEQDTANILLDSGMKKDYWKKQSDLITTAGFEVFGRMIDYELYANDELTDIELRRLNNQSPVDEPLSVAKPTSPLVSGLNEKYNFENFVQGPGNRWTLAAAIAVADKPGDTYNPLFIYGGAGLGKTHLMHAIGNQILTDNPTARIKYVSSENFVNDYVNATRKNQMESFENTYRNLDLLLLDLSLIHI